MNKLEFKVEGRNGYWAIDRYLGDSCQDHVGSFSTKGLANSVCSGLNDLAHQLNKANKLLEQSALGMPQGWILVEDINTHLRRYK
jgi:hypothetical protein